MAKALILAQLLLLLLFSFASNSACCTYFPIGIIDWMRALLLNCTLIICNFWRQFWFAIVATIALWIGFRKLLYFKCLNYINVILFKIFYFVYFEILTTLLFTHQTKLVSHRKPDFWWFSTYTARILKINWHNSQLVSIN